MTVVHTIEIPSIAPHSRWPDAADLLRAIQNAPLPDIDKLRDVLVPTGAPFEDLVLTPYALRSALLGAHAGRAFFHHERRQRIDPSDDMKPEFDVWSSGGLLPVWENGVLHEPKYFSFFQEAPLASYNPNHRRKWRTHELAHGAVGFFWAPEMTRFEMYVGARLNELIPVVLWYGLDNVFRPRCPIHQEEVGTSLCRACESMTGAYWERQVHPESWDQAVRSIENAIEHFVAEIAACRAELASGVPLELPRGALNASSDATGYMRAHWNRSTSYHYGQWIERFHTQGFDHFDNLSDFVDTIEGVFQTLLWGRIAIDPEVSKTRRLRRHLQDIAMRFYQCLAHRSLAQEERILARSQAPLDALEQACRDLADGRPVSAAKRDELERWQQMLHDSLADENGASGPLPAHGLGWMGRQADPAELAQVRAGLTSGLDGLGDTTRDADLQDFVDHPGFSVPQTLLKRFAAWAAERGEDHDGRIRMRAWYLAEPLRDPWAEDFSVVPEDASALERPGVWRLNESHRRAIFPRSAVREFIDIEAAGPDVDVVAWYWSGELRMLPLDGGAAELLDALEPMRSSWRSVAQQEWESFSHLCEVGLIVWLPAPLTGA